MLQKACADTTAGLAFSRDTPLEKMKLGRVRLPLKGSHGYTIIVKGMSDFQKQTYWQQRSY